MSDRKSIYLTASQLRIEPWEREGLIAFLEESRLETWNKEDSFDMNFGCLLRSEIFNDPEDCGTVYCIGGFVALHGGMNRSVANLYVLHEHSSSLKPLYYPYQYSYDISSWSKITREQAVQAVENFLENGDPNWEKIARSSGGTKP